MHIMDGPRAENIFIHSIISPDTLITEIIYYFCCVVNKIYAGIQNAFIYRY